MTRLKIITIVLCCFSLVALAQEQTVNGIIWDAAGEPIPGVNVLVKGTAKGVVSDFDGLYSIKAESGETLVFSYVGFLTKEIALTGQTKLNVTMKPDLNQLDEVVVVGYGSLRKKDITGSVVSVKVDETFSQQIQTVDQMLKGRIAGVQMIGGDGSPNAGVSIKIRGTSSLRGGSDPLYVIDGVIMSSAGEDAASATDKYGGTQESQNALNGINPRDIESMQILKDASATAIYGNRGANGVVIITTKKGSKGQTRITAFSTTTVTQIDNKVDVLSGVDYARYRNEAQSNNGDNPRYSIDNNQVYVIRDGVTDTAAAELINYQDEMYTTGISNSYGGSFSGGGDKSTHYVSFGYNDLEGVTKTSNLKNGNLRINLGHQILPKLKIDTRFSAYYGEGSMFQNADQWGGNRTVVHSALTRNPILGDSDDPSDNSFSPLESINDYEDLSKESRLIASVSLKYNLPVEGLTYSLQVGGDLRHKERRRWYGLATFQGSSANGILGMSKLIASQYSINNLFHYNKTFNEDHRINAMAGFSFEEKSRNNLLFAVKDFANHTFKSQQPVFGEVTDVPNQILSPNEDLKSYMSRVNYSFKDKYVLTATFRMDASSKFTDNNKWGYFPSFAAAWRLSNEPFIASINAIDDLKLRAGWGQTGSQTVPPFQTLTNYGATQYPTAGNGTAIGLYSLNIPNPDLKWETTQQINVGLDFQLFKDRLSGTLDIYKSDINDLIQNMTLPASSGYPVIATNFGNLESKGLEIALNGTVIRNEDMTFGISGNIAFNKTKIGTLGQSEAMIFTGGDTAEMRSFYLGQKLGNRSEYNIFIEGEEAGLFYGLKTDGIYQEGDTDILAGRQAGDVRFVDLNEDGKIDGSDRTIIGNPNPEFTYGASLDFSYKRLSVSAQFDGVYGNEIITASFEELDIAMGDFNNITVDAYQQAWRPDAPSNTYPRIGANIVALGGPADRLVHDGSYFRLNNLTIGYDLPLEKFVSKCHLYVAASNLFTLTSYPNYTPIITSFMNNPGVRGVDFFNTPNASTFTVGLTVNF